MIANLNLPMGVAVDRDGNVYVSDSGNHRILKVTPAGSVSTVAGQYQIQGSCGDGGPATQACLSWPGNLALDGAGDLYICDEGTNEFTRLRKVTAATGIITTVGVTGPTGPGTPGFSFFRDIAIDSAGNIFVADGYAYVFKISAAGVLSTVVGGLHGARAIELDASGNLFIADGDRVLEVSADTGIVTRIAGTGTGPYVYSGDGGPADQAGINAQGLAFDLAGNLYVSDSGYQGIRKVTMATGTITTVAGTGAGTAGPDGLPATWTDFKQPTALAFDNDGRLLVASAGDARLRRIVFPQDDVPLAGDLDGDGRADLVLWRPATGTWNWLTSSSDYSPAAAQSIQWGASATADVPLLADIDGDGKADLVIYRPATGTWHWLTSSSGYSVAVAGAKQFGNRTDIPIAADLDGDGKADLILWRPSDGTWYWLSSSSGYSDGALQSKQWGNGVMGDSPLTADIDGDGRMDLTVWRRVTSWWWAPSGVWFWIQSGQMYDYASAACRWWGDWLQHDVPMAADIDGDGKADLIVWRPTDGTWYWTTSSHNYTGTTARQWGSALAEIGDQPLTGDFDGDGKTDLAIWRGSTGTWFLLMSADQYSYVTARAIQWGSTR